MIDGATPALDGGRTSAMRAALLVLLVACGSSEPSKASKIEQERAKAEAACDDGDGPSCFAATLGLDPMDKKQLERAMELWSRGCALNHAASCGQLGTVEQFGMTSGGAKPDERLAAMYYAKACRLGDKQSCTALGYVDPAGAIGR
jgi:hypothetical protein